MEPNFICCFTGHRNIRSEHAQQLKAELDRVMEILVRSGVKTFRTGGAMGFDTLAALTVLELREKDPSIRLELCLPCKNQTDKWDGDSVEYYKYILDRADKVTFLHDLYTPSCMLERNRFMVDGSTFCVAYCLNTDAKRGGSAYTVRYARSKNVRVINLADRL